MSINSMNSRFAMAEKMSIPQLQQSVQTGSLPAYVGVPLIGQRMQEQKKAAALAQLAQAQQQAQQFGVPTEKPIAQGIMEQASGIEAMPSNLPVAGYNDGGIVAFAEGGDADEDFDYEEFQDERDQSEYQDLLASYMAEAEAAGVAGIPINKTKKVEVGVEKKADGGIIGLKEGGIPRFQSAGYVDANGISYTPEDVGVVSNEGPSLKQWWNETAKPYLRGKGGSYDPNDLYGTPVLPPVEVTAEPERNLEDMDITRDSGVMGGDLPKVDTGGAKANPKGIANLNASGAGASPTARERPKSAFDDFIANIKEERAALAKQKQDDKYMALLTAGLGMMSGTSPNAFANIGQGAQAGVAQYGASAKQRAAEKAALNKNLLMGQRYQSMEDIAARTADINEARYRDAAARAAAGGSGKEDEQNRRRLNDMGNLAQRYEKTLVDQLKLKFNPDIYPKEFAAGLREISKDPRLQMYNSAINKLADQMYGFSSETQQTPPPSGNVIQYDNKGNRIK